MLIYASSVSFFFIPEEVEQDSVSYYFLILRCFRPIRKAQILRLVNLNVNLVIKGYNFELLTEFSSSCHLFVRSLRSVSPVGKKF